MRALTIILSETIDPNGALWRWMSPDLESLGHHVIRFPTQELVHLLSPDAISTLFSTVVIETKADLAIVHPPLDFLSDDACDLIRTSGCRLLGLGMDDPLYEHCFSSRTSNTERYDARYTFSRARQAIQQGAIPLRWAISGSSLTPHMPMPDTPSHELVLVGRARPARVALVERLMSEGVDIGAYGHGWENGPVNRGQMVALWTRAHAVLTPHDGHNMVKSRVLETAWCNQCQLIQWSEDLSDYLPKIHPDIWHDVTESLSKLPKPRTPMPELRTHTWKVRFPELVAQFVFPDTEPTPRWSPSLAPALAAAAHHLESIGRMEAADAMFEEWLRHTPSAHAAAGRMRIAHRQARYDDAVQWSDLARTNYIGSQFARDAGGFLSHGGQGSGLGMTGALDPTLEWDAIRLHSLLRGSAPAKAVSALQAVPNARRKKLAAFLEPETPPIEPEFWRLLAEAS